MMKAGVTLLALLLLPFCAYAHKPSDSYLTIDMRQAEISLRWDIALRDLELAMGLDTDGDRRLTWAEVKAGQQAIASYALGRLRLVARDRDCALRAGRQQLVDHSDGTYSVLSVQSDCTPAQLLALHYDLLFDIDPTHRGLLRVIGTNRSDFFVLAPEDPEVALETGAQTSRWPTFVQFAVEGVRHIWIGLDHILFLLTLLLPFAVRWPAQTAEGMRSGRLRQIVLIVTAFTVAHSVTLSVASFGLVSLPSRWVESAIAATILLSAVNNIRPFLPGPRWAIAFALGLIHGFGFASVLADLGLPTSAFIVALGGFNLGVELGQLVVVLLLVPAAAGFRRAFIYQVPAMRTASLAIAAVASVWLIERGFNLEVMPL